MKIESDPRCPKHYEYSVFLTWSPSLDTATWCCSVCKRPLGGASFGVRQALRKEPLWLQSMSAVDWEWKFARYGGFDKRGRET
jgi:hypothetical protein